MIINNLISEHTKSYATEANLIKAVEKALGVHPQKTNDYDLIIIVQDGRFKPIIKWRHPFQYRTGDSIHAGFYTIN